ncbi:MAG TPA: MarR family transcriptional regulator [Sporichthya sp.]|nr:MarR family transcriptional regulator [Sporichthya sp.]
MASSRKKLAADAWGALLRAQAEVLPVLDREMRISAGIPLGWYDVLLELQAAQERRLTMSQLGERAVLSRTRVSRVVDDLVRAGFVMREPNPADARSAFAVLTETGHARFRQAAPIYLAGIEREFAARLSDADLRQLATTLGRVRG